MIAVDIARSGAFLGPMPEVHAWRGREVLLVEDNMDDAFLFSRAFKETFPGSSISAVPDAEAATRFLSAGRHDMSYLPAAIFVDLGLPGKNGTDLLQWIEHEPHLSRTLLCVISGSVNEASKTTTSSGRDVIYLSKPVTGAAMSAALAARKS